MQIGTLITVHLCLIIGYLFNHVNMILYQIAWGMCNYYCITCPAIKKIFEPFGTYILGYLSDPFYHLMQDMY